MQPRVFLVYGDRIECLASAHNHFSLVVDFTPTLRAFKCSESESLNSRNLVVCIDGTSNRFNKKNTNIVELYSHVSKNDKQLTYYSSGLGTIAQVTGASLRHRFSSDLDMMFGRNLHKVIMASYRWLSDNYRDGDRIFLFGFSRGAYQVRTLAGMIARVGLLLPGNNEQIPFAFDLYSKTDDDDPSLTGPASVISKPVTKQSEKKAEYAVLAKTFQKTFCRTNVHIHFVGVWDTVSSVGIGRSRPLPGTTTSCEHICYFRHALALDERRVKFLPEYVYGGRSSNSDDGRIKEVWFAGSHSDVGGGNRQNEKLQSGDIPLLWMRSQAIAAGLEMVPADVMWKIDDLNKQITPSLTPAWWVVELMPLRRLLYYNSDRHTSRPHCGDPRRILPGQKVHVSVLFKNNYKPGAQFYNNPIPWPEPMFWNDVASHQRLQNLPDLWEKDIFDDRVVHTLLDDLKNGQSVLNALDRLAFLTGFDDYKNALSLYQDAKQILATFLQSRDPLVRLSTAVIYCELGWDWPLETTQGELAQKIMEDISGLLKSSDHCRRACMWMPSLCKRPDLKGRLINNVHLRMLVEYCDNMRISKHEEGTSTVAFHSAQALSMLMKLDDGVATKLIEGGLVGDIIEALHSNCNPVLVAVLSIVDGIAREDVAAIKNGPIVATLIKLVKKFDDFVAPVATRVLCSLLPEDDLRRNMLRSGVLPIFLDMLEQCSDGTKQSTCGALINFLQHADVRQELLGNNYLGKLAKRAQSHLPAKSDGALLALETFGNTQVARKDVTEAIKAAKTIPHLIEQLRQKSTALSAASTLARLVRIDDVAVMVSADESVATAIMNMLQNRWFDGLRGEDGLQVLAELFRCERLWFAVLKTGVIDTLRKMIDSERYESRYAGLHYLRIIARFDERSLPTRDMQSLIQPIVSALRAPQRRVQKIAMEALWFFSVEEELRTALVDSLLSLLRDRQASVILAASTALAFLSTDESVRDKIVKNEAFWNLSHDYYNGNLDQDLQNKGPRTGEVYESVGHLIKLVQAQESDRAGPAVVEDQRIDNRWFAPATYELKKDNRPGAYWIATLLCFPPLLLSRTGRRVYRELWQEG